MNPSPESNGFFYTGNSMAGTFAPGDRLLTEKTDFPALICGDIIIFQRDDKLIVHRVIAVAPDKTLITKGDNNARKDRESVQPALKPLKVVSKIDSRGHAHAVSCGPAGMKEHRRRQKTLHLRMMLTFFTPDFLRKSPLRWMICKKKIKVVEFQQLQVLYYGKSAIATRKQGCSYWRFKRRWLRLFFQNPGKN